MEPTLSTRLLVTARGLHTTRLARRAIERALPTSRVRSSGFGGIVLVDADVTVTAELLGPSTAVGISRKRWRPGRERGIEASAEALP